MSANNEAPTRPPRRRARAAAAWCIIAMAGCDSDGIVGRASTPMQHVLRVQGNGVGSGTVTAPDASPQLSCSITRGALAGVCAMAYPSNSAVRLVAMPNGASAFAGWTGSCAGAGDCVVDMAQERTVTATFTP